MFALTKNFKNYFHEAIVATLLVFVDFMTNFSWISTRDPALTSGSRLSDEPYYIASINMEQPDKPTLHKLILEYIHLLPDFSLHFLPWDLASMQTLKSCRNPEKKLQFVNTANT